MLSKHDYRATLNKKRKQRHGSTCTWIFQVEAYNRWCESVQSSVFYLCGGSTFVFSVPPPPKRIICTDELLASWQRQERPDVRHPCSTC